MKSLKIRLYPTKEQEVLFRKFIGAERYIYNWGLSLNNELYKAKKKEIFCQWFRKDVNSTQKRMFMAKWNF